MICTIKHTQISHRHVFPSKIQDPNENNEHPQLEHTQIIFGGITQWPDIL